MGSLALSLCHLAAGRVDAVCSPEARALGRHRGRQLLVRECGLAIELFDDPPFGRRRSTSWGAHGSWRRVPPSYATRWKPPLPHGCSAATLVADPEGVVSCTYDWEGFAPRNALPLRELLHKGVTLIRLTIPAPTASPPHGRPSTSAHTRPRRRTILVCDDDPSLRELLRPSRSRYRFIEAADGTEALVGARESTPT